MYFEIGKHPEAQNYMPFDLDKREAIKNCIWADDISGKYCINEIDKDGKHMFLTDDLGRIVEGVNLQLKTRVKKGRIKLINVKEQP